MDELNERENIGKLTIKNFAWLTGARGVSQIITLVITSILARLLTPADFGLMGMVTIVTGLLIRFNDFGTGMAVIQKKDLKDEQLSSIFWFNISLGILISIALILGSYLVAGFYNQPLVIPLMSVMAVGFTINGFGIVQEALLRKSLKLNIVVRITTTGTIIAGILGVITAFLGWGVWALVVQSLTQLFINNTLFWFFSSWRPMFKFSSEDIKEIKGFSTGIIGFNLLNYFSRNADYLLIGRYLGASQLGLYTLAYKIMLFPIHNLNGIANQALFPAFSKVQTDKKWVGDAFVKTNSYIAMLTFPLMAFISLQAQDVILVLYGPGWSEATFVLRVLSIVAIFQPIFALSGTLILSKGFSQWFFRFALVTSSFTIVSFIIGLQWGIEGVATLYLISQSLLFIFGMPLLMKKGEASFRDLMKNLIWPGIGLAVMVVSLVGVNSVVAETLESPFVRLAVTGAISFILYGAVLLWSPVYRKKLFQDFQIVSASIRY